jgi:hypothetical protein
MAQQIEFPDMCRLVIPTGLELTVDGDMVELHAEGCEIYFNLHKKKDHHVDGIDEESLSRPGDDFVHRCILPGLPGESRLTGTGWTGNDEWGQLQYYMEVVGADFDYGLAAVQASLKSPWLAVISCRGMKAVAEPLVLKFLDKIELF